MSVLDAIQSSTITPSKSLMIDKQVGSIEIGKKSRYISMEYSRY